MGATFPNGTSALAVGASGVEMMDVSSPMTNPPSTTTSQHRPINNINRSQPIKPQASAQQ